LLELEIVRIPDLQMGKLQLHLGTIVSRRVEIEFEFEIAAGGM